MNSLLKFDFEEMMKAREAHEREETVKVDAPCYKTKEEIQDPVEYRCQKILAIVHNTIMRMNSYGKTDGFLAFTRDCKSFDYCRKGVNETKRLPAGSYFEMLRGTEIKAKPNMYELHHVVDSLNKAGVKAKLLHVDYTLRKSTKKGERIVRKGYVIHVSWSHQ